MATVSCDPPDTECSVCHNNFVQPKILLCGHLLCRECIVSIIKSENHPDCPLCLDPIASPEALESQSPESIADSLPTDFVMDALVLIVALKTQRPVYCGCRREEADSICLQCWETLCPACTTAHNNSSVTCSHEVKSLGTVTVETLAASCVPLCECHGEKIKYFCSDHEIAVCSSCVVETHKSCPEMSDLDTEMNAAKEAVKDLNETLSSAENKMEKSINELNTCLMGWNSCEKLCNRLGTFLNKYTKTLKSASSKKVLESGARS
ncbi:probable RING finger protein 207 homolog [Pomacea canaliculata]|uniref:probable RING finger protein 207 homolog n=1 Tax=Pomacea canaliculata TaxID=400727 RepID=UPI000D7327D3|nr:probable RING finger protein 207 homolog [Pomacea canaliculata]